MNNKSMLIMGAIIATACSPGGKITYPETERTNVNDTLWGEVVADPYRWLENDTSAATAQWVEAQNAVTNSYLADIPFREALRNRLNEVSQYATESMPWKKNGKYYFYRNDGVQNQSVLYEKESLDAEARMILDPNALSEDGTVALSSVEISPDGKYLAYAISRSGSDWNEVFVMDLNTLELLPDHVEWIKFSPITWYNDGFYYSAFKPEIGKELSATNKNHTIYYHKLGTSTEQDRRIYCNEENEFRYVSGEISDDKKYLVISESAGTSGVGIYLQSLTGNDHSIRCILPGYDYDYVMVGMHNGCLLFYTNDNAPNYRLIAVNPQSPQRSAWKEIIPEQDNVLSGVTLANGRILASYAIDVMSHLYCYSMDGEQLYEVQLPGNGTLQGISGSPKEKEVFYTYTSFTYPQTVYTFDTESRESELYYTPQVDFDPEQYVSEQLFFTSKDGTRIPMTVTHRKGMELDGKNPTLLYGYGGFAITLNPRFINTMIPFLEEGGVYAEVNLRGGNEYGEEWHVAGTKMQKQNVFDDFIGAAEYLIAQGYTSPAKLAINGGSNGGLLVGACMTQRPDLYAVAVPQVGVLDMLRYHRFTIGWGWAGDYGTADDSKEMFRYLIGYSPLHTLREGTTYPATLVMTADHDDRVVPAHSFKFAAELQHCNDGINPTLIRIDSKAGHGAGRPRHKIVDEKTDMFAFIMYNLGMNPKF
ncbi:MAG: S9 family peptidase [Bacteroidaceae bacterium]|nr:S9 family peptidase [Bacteroidaceae bacterium]